MSSPAPSASAASCSTASFTQFPTQDIACAVGSTTSLPSNTSSILTSCCKSAPVEHFNGDCGYYCLSVEQTVAELQACFMQGGVSPSSIFCSGNNTATATERPEASGGSSTQSGTASPGAAAGVVVPWGVSKAGLGMVGMVVVSVVVGAVL